jgi:hypothetical protein
MKRILTVVLVGMLLLSLSSCGKNKTDQELKADANEIVAAFEKSDINSISSLIFDVGSLNIDEELSDFFTDAEDETGILAYIFTYDTVTVKKIYEAEKEITYEVKAPDLTNFFSDLSDDVLEMTELDFEQYLLEYIQSVDTITTSVVVSYVYNGESFSANYKTAEFINAITGGLLYAYQSLYQEMIDEYLQNMEEAE